jgi:quinol monooxygenase YgiN
MTNFGMVGKLTAEPHNRDALVEILTRAAERMEAFDGCHLYVVSKDADDTGAVWVMELWESKQAHDDSLALPEVRELISEAMPLIVGNPEGTSLIPVSGKGI